MPFWQVFLSQLFRTHRAPECSTRDDDESIAVEGNEQTPFVLEVNDVLDLHAFAPKEISEAVEIYLEEARKKGFSIVRIIHGKGIGVQRERVRSVLSRTPFVARFRDAPIEAGGWGATLVWFK
jgi:dsDNA-specific endonuclease/ATPase MutS2